LEKLGVDIQLGREATPELIEATKPEALFIATGSTQTIPEIPGVERKEVVTAIDLLLGKRIAGESVAVIGGGLVGCEIALYLAQKGRKLIILEILDIIMGDMYSINREHMKKLLADNGVRILTETKVLEITEVGIEIADRYNKRDVLKADTVVLAAGFKPNDSLSEALKDKVPEIYILGDCVMPRRVIHAVWEGFRFARLT
jgi:2-enoate reductase